MVEVTSLVPASEVTSVVPAVEVASLVPTDVPVEGSDVVVGLVVDADAPPLPLAVSPLVTPEPSVPADVEADADPVAVAVLSVSPRLESSPQPTTSPSPRTTRLSEGMRVVRRLAVMSSPSGSATPLRGRVCGLLDLSSVAAN
ncbi:MAG: hypothetical protein H6711_35005 [Myxococcales bacterium]|nr:hypothetical protein [Myxococcales bacterium]